MTSLETTRTLDLDRSVFDSNDIRILSAAFERAWTFVESDPDLEVLELAKRQSELARCLMTLEKLGEISPTSLANAGIAMLRARYQGGAEELIRTKHELEQKKAAAISGEPLKF